MPCHTGSSTGDRGVLHLVLQISNLYAAMPCQCINACMHACTRPQAVALSSAAPNRLYLLCVKKIKKLGSLAVHSLLCSKGQGDTRTVIVLLMMHCPPGSIKVAVVQRAVDGHKKLGALQTEQHFQLRQLQQPHRGRCGGQPRG